MCLLTQKSDIYLIVTECLDDLRNVKQNGILETFRKKHFTSKKRKKSVILHKGVPYKFCGHPLDISQLHQILSVLSEMLCLNLNKNTHLGILM